MGWQVTTVAARAGRYLGLRRRWRAASEKARARAAARTITPGPDVVARVAERIVERLPEHERFATRKALVDLPKDRLHVARRALATGASPAAVRSLIREWPTFGEMERSIMIDPIGRADAGPVAWGETAARQVDDTTCGAATMAMMTLIGDPFVGLWLASGRIQHRRVPPEVARTPGWSRMSTIEDRWNGLQRAIHRHTTRFGLGPFPWPRSLGTPPWRVNDTLRYAGLRFRGAVVDDTDDADVSALIDHAAYAIADGIPVPAYAAGDSDRGLDTAIPRHVVLFTHRSDNGFLAYEPSTAALHFVADNELRDGGAKVAAFGGWSHLAWMVLPRARR